MVFKTRRKKFIILLIFCAILLILFALHCFLFNLSQFMTTYSKWTQLTEYSRYSHYSLLSKHNLSVDENVIKNNNKFLNNNTKKIVVLWTTFFKTSDYMQSTYESSYCSLNNCIFTSNRSYLRQSEAVLFHLRDLNLKDWPKYRTPEQRYILLHHESPPNTPKILNKIESLINWTATYRYGSDVFLSPKFIRRTKPNPNFKPNVNYAENKTRLAVWLSSNCKTDSNRETYVEELKKTVTVDVFGKCGHKVCLPKMSYKCLEQVSNEYRFILAFENSICRDYVTEKYFNSLDFNIIPVVFGGSDYRKIAPKKSFIDALSYTSPRHLARYLLYLSKNPKQYNEYFQWKRDYKLEWDYYGCQICRKLNDPSEPIKVWHNLNSWWFDSANCRRWTPSKYFH